jgi:ribose 5-phosphate isomerase B
MKVAIGSDHAGYRLKEEVKALLQEMGIEHTDYGCMTEDSCDYPDIAAPVAQAVASGEVDRGILICGTGIGMSIAANKIRGIRASLCHDMFSARMTREHNNSNVLAIGARVIGSGLALEIAKIWLTTEYQGGRHGRRLAKISLMETPMDEEE